MVVRLSANWDIATVHFLCLNGAPVHVALGPPFRQQKQNRAPALINHYPSTLLNVGWLRHYDEWPSVSGSGPPNGKSTYTRPVVHLYRIVVYPKSPSLVTTGSRALTTAVRVGLATYRAHTRWLNDQPSIGDKEKNTS